MWIAGHHRSVSARQGIVKLTDTDIPASIPVIQYIVFIIPSIHAVPSFQPDVPYPLCSRNDTGCFS